MLKLPRRPLLKRKTDGSRSPLHLRLQLLKRKSKRRQRNPRSWWRDRWKMLILRRSLNSNQHWKIRSLLPTNSSQVWVQQDSELYRFLMRATLSKSVRTSKVLLRTLSTTRRLQRNWLPLEVGWNRLEASMVWWCLSHLLETIIRISILPRVLAKTKCSAHRLWGSLNKA